MHAKVVPLTDLLILHLFRDRRSLSGGKPAGVLPGHTEGITFVAPKGDGRYCISNGKDQSTKLWDLRMMVSSQDFERMPRAHYGLRQWDYRSMCVFRFPCSTEVTRLTSYFVPEI